MSAATLADAVGICRSPAVKVEEEEEEEDVPELTVVPDEDVDWGESLCCTAEHHREQQIIQSVRVYHLY